jgi:taurine dioxygenase
MELVPTGGPLGAKVRGVDLATDPSPHAIEAIRTALRDHLVLVFRSQTLTRQRIIEIAGWFGGCYEPRADVLTLGDGSLDPIVVVSNVHERGVFGSGEVGGHADQEYLPDPSPATLLYAVEVPSTGGETSWANLLLAYEELPRRVRARIEGLERWTDNPYVRPDEAFRRTVGAAQRITAGDAPVALHPLVRTQPDTGRRALYVSSITTGIRGLRGPAASLRAAWLLRRLKRHVDQPHLYYTHRWRPGDFVVWDNLHTVHKRAAFDASERRILHRCQIAPLPAE